MANDPKNPEVGELVIDASDLSTVIVDLAPGALRGMLSSREDFDDVFAEIVANQALYGEKAGITATDFNILQQATSHITIIDKILPAAHKLVELLEETRCHLDDQRQRQVHAIAKSVEMRVKMQRNPDLLARYARTRSYRSAIAAKAVRTRLRNQAEAEAEAAAADSADSASSIAR